ncbi:hypothetical protein FOZ61_007068 [Perkinsus olseni]|uniref:Uncharacterized protein n=1 Tax=Perkinsus olseni TaxID=32597 RepID=A0A7J6LKU1_PEROL|nr:hypothetical protein FOZ61_007068 [Perkinsus olseni]KAF4659650.1 hypothetical protein FOL46_006519 [Perkinsus olseni]
MIPENESQSDLEEALRLVQGGGTGPSRSADKSPVRLLLDEAYSLQKLLNRPGGVKVELELSRQCSKFISIVVQLCNDTEAGYVCPDDFDRKAPGYQRRVMVGEPWSPHPRLHSIRCSSVHAIQELRSEVEAYEARVTAAQDRPKPVNGVIRRIDEVHASSPGNGLNGESGTTEEGDPSCGYEEVWFNIDDLIAATPDGCNQARLCGFGPGALSSDSAVDALLSALRSMTTAGAPSQGLEEPQDAVSPIVVDLDLRGSGVTVSGLQKVLPALATEGLLPSLEILRIDAELTEDPSVALLIKGFSAFRKDVRVDMKTP